MAELIDKTEETEDVIIDTQIRVDDLKEAAPVSRMPTLKYAAPIVQDNVAAQIPSDTEIKAAEELLAKVFSGQQNLRDQANKGTASIPVTRLDKLKIKQNTDKDLRQLSEEDVYNPDFQIDAKPLFLGDSLKIDLKDTNYIGRWVQKSSQRIAMMLGRGFSFVVKEDLNTDLDIGIFLDSTGRYINGDVVAMKIQRQRYYEALRYSHNRAQNAISPKGAHKAAIKTAQEFMQKQDSSFSELSSAKKVSIYSPEVDI